VGPAIGKEQLPNFIKDRVANFSTRIVAFNPVSPGSRPKSTKNLPHRDTLSDKGYPRMPSLALRREEGLLVSLASTATMQNRGGRRNGLDWPPFGTVPTP